MASNGVGVGVGYNNPFVWADRLNNQASADQFDPNAYVDPNQIAQQSMMLNQQLQKQAFNQNDPKAALPQNFGSFLSSAAQKIGGFGSGAPQAQAQSPQQDPVIEQVKGYIHNAIAGNLQDDSDFGKAPYNAAVAALKDPAFAGNPAAEQVAEKYIQDSVSRYKYNPNEQKDADVSRAVQRTALDKAQTDLAADKQKQQYVVVDTAPGKSGLAGATPYSPTLSMFNADGTDNHAQFAAQSAKYMQDARDRGATMPTLVPLDTYMRNQSDLQQQKMQLEQQKAVLEAAAQGAVSPDGQKRIAQGLVNYTIDPMSLSYRTRDQYLDAAKALDPNYDEKNYTQAKAAVTAFSPSGVQGKSLISLDTALRHSETLRQLIIAQNNNDPQLINKAKNAFKTEFGMSTAPTDVAAAIVPYATEVLKSISPNGGTLEERQALTKAINAPAAFATQGTSAVDKLEGMFLDRATAMKDSYTSQSRKMDFNSLQGAGGLLDKKMRQYEKSKYDGGTVVTSLDDYNKVPTGSPYTNQMPGSANFGKVGVRQ